MEGRQHQLRRQEAFFAATCQAVRENRPDTTEINLVDTRYPIINDARAHAIGEAARGNTFVKELFVNAGTMNRAGSHGIWQFIASSPSLGKLKLRPNWRLLQLQQNPNEAEILDQFLMAASFNPHIHELHAPDTFGTLALTTFLRSRREKLDRLDLDFKGPANGVLVTQEMETDADLIANSVGDHPTLENLVLVGRNDHCFIPKILARLVDHPSLKSLSSELGIIDYPDAIQSILNSSTPLETLELNDFEHEGPIDSILTGLHGHATVRTLSIVLHSTTNSEEVAHVANMLRHNHVLKKLTVFCIRLVDTVPILEALATSNTTLTTLGLYLQNSDLFEEACQRFAMLLPRVRYLKNLTIEGIETDSALGNERLLRGLKDNPSLTDVDISWFQNNEDAATYFYTTRNKYNPALASASKAKMLTIFNILLSEHDDECGLSVVFEALRASDNWFERIEGGVLKIEEPAHKRRRTRRSRSPQVKATK